MNTFRRLVSALASFASVSCRLSCTLLGLFVLFEHAFATTAICCSSRANILTGQLMYEESIRVPLIVADPRLPAATRGRRTAMALTIDLGADPREEKNLATAPTQRATLARLRARCDDYRVSLK
jgi:hypothetical protein